MSDPIIELRKALQANMYGDNRVAAREALENTATSSTDAQVRSQLETLLKEVVEAFGYEDKTWLHAVLHIKNAVSNLRCDASAANSELERVTKERDNALARIEQLTTNALSVATVLGEFVAERDALAEKLKEKTTQYEDLRFDMSLLRGALRMEPEELAKLKQDKARLDWVDANDKTYWESDCRQLVEHHAFEVASKKGQTVREAIDAEMEEA